METRSHAPLRVPMKPERRVNRLLPRSVGSALDAIEDADTRQFFAACYQYLLEKLKTITFSIKRPYRSAEFQCPWTFSLKYAAFIMAHSRRAEVVFTPGPAGEQPTYTGRIALLDAEPHAPVVTERPLIARDPALFRGWRVEDADVAHGIMQRVHAMYVDMPVVYTCTEYDPRPEARTYRIVFSGLRLFNFTFAAHLTSAYETLLEDVKVDAAGDALDITMVVRKVAAPILFIGQRVDKLCLPDEYPTE